MIDLVISSKLKSYRRRHYVPEDTKDGIAFERFANHSIISMHHPDSVDLDADLMDLICVGGENDMGIDGIAIKFNGVFIKSEQDIKDIISLNGQAEAEFIFIQSKYREDFDSGEYGKFCDGISDFLSDTHYEPHNDRIEDWLKIKEYIFSDEVFERADWLSNPKVRVYYVWLGTWNGNPHIEAKFSQLADNIQKTKIYGEVIPNYIDNDTFKKMRDEIDNAYTFSLTTSGELQLTDADKIKKSSIFLCMADEYVKMLETSEGYIRKAVFFDNVRDFQGMTGINSDVLNTIKETPDSFILLNNGITVICDSFEQLNKRIKIKNPQIVNGCQTSNVLFLAKQQGCDLSKVSLAMKLIETADDEIVNAIVKGTNKQNSVFEVAFETTRPFHKELEKYFEAMTSEETEAGRLYYERRSKQFWGRTDINVHQKINIRIITQSFISIFLKKPHLGHRHEAFLIKEYGKSIFIDGQNFYQYYIAAKFYAKLETYFFNSPDDKRHLIKYKNQILLIFSELLAELLPDYINAKPNINDFKLVNEYCTKIHRILKDDATIDRYVKRAFEMFTNLKEKWIAIKGQAYRYAVKDSESFTAFMLNNLNGGTAEASVENVAQVAIVRLDRNYRRYCFIRTNPVNLFAHSCESDVDFDLLEPDMSVVYHVELNKIDGKERAIIDRIIG